MFEGFLEVVVRHADHGDTLLNGYSGTPPEKPGGGFGSDPGSKLTGGTPTVTYIALSPLHSPLTPL